MPPKRPLGPDPDELQLELHILQDQQDKALAMAAYIRMSKDQETQFDERRKRIHELYETLLRLRRPATQS